MINQFKRPNGKPYAANNAAEYAELCLDRWDKLMGATPKSIVLTGQAYWGEGKPPFPKAAAEAKLEEFLAGWSRFNRVTGLNWWHFGGEQAMSHRMLEDIVSAGLKSKPYKP
jgi:hypothetical protein